MDAEIDYPVSSKAIRENFYVDDLLLSMNIPEKITKVCRQVSLLLFKRGFELRKWRYNSSDVLRRLNVIKEEKFEIHGSTSCKVLGLQWKSSTDVFCFTPHLKIYRLLTKQNHVDIATRDINPQNLGSCRLWWHETNFLHQDFHYGPLEDPAPERIPKELLAQRSDPIFSKSCAIYPTLHIIFEKHSSLAKIIHILAYCRRFIVRCKLGTNLASETIYSSLSDIIEIKSILFRWVQERHFPDKLNSLQAGKTLSPSSKILSFNSFLDNGVLRAGGRIRRSNLPFKSKHPILLPGNHKISAMIIQEAHIANSHAGPTVLAHILKQTYWIVGSKNC
ncbi:reverse transcriptase [Caerostris darwini]|uniref:Reverse transcriptase n=1 Tax=Caerostris darwini TaxID=1538125 RepID=A0AAV4NGR5_9ARAC|nr:reverse transcriptase [Caerostris darwini]